MCKLRIPKALINLAEIERIFNCSPSKETKNYWQLDNVTPAQIDTWLIMSKPNTAGVKISRRYSECFPQFATF